MTGQFDRRTALALLMAGAAMPSLARAQSPAGKLSAATLAALDAAARAELEQKAIPSLAIALVDRSGVLWAGGWGFADAEKTVPATADSLYRTGAAGRIVTDLLLKDLVAAGRVDLDKPVVAYLPDFAPKNPFGKPPTVRHLAEHRSGLVREAGAGSPLDLREASVEQTELALNRTALRFEPGSQVKYSDAGLRVLAAVVEAAWGAPFAVVAQKKLFEPMGLAHSGYSPAEAGAELVYAEIGSYDSGRMAAPLTQADAALGGLHTTANDLGRLVQAAMAAPAAGLEAGEVDGRASLGQGASVLGCTAEARFLSGEGLGVAVLAALNDCPTARRLADFALALMLAERAGRPAPVFALSRRLGDGRARALAGHFADGETSLFLRELVGGLYLEQGRTAGEVRALSGGALVVDDPQAYAAGLEIDPQGQWVKLQGRSFRRSEWARPAAPPDSFAGLVGDYGWEQGYIRVFERDGRPWARVGWADWEPLTQTGPDELSFGPDGGYRLESLRFVRGEAGKGEALSLGGLSFPRRDFGADMLARTRAMASNSKGLRTKAKKASPPQETGKDEPDLVPIRSADPSIKLDIRYATTNNFMGFPLYAREGAYLERPAAEAVGRASRSLRDKGFGLVIHDGYRPWFVTKMFWDATPPEGHVFVADPSQGSRHNRGAAVDLSLYDLETGEEVKMTGGYDEMSARSYPQYVGGTSLERWRRDTLRQAMEAQGFEVYAAEWWHFDFNGWERYPILDLDFDQIDRMAGRPRT